MTIRNTKIEINQVTGNERREKEKEEEEHENDDNLGGRRENEAEPEEAITAKHREKLKRQADKSDREDKNKDEIEKEE